MLCPEKMTKVNRRVAPGRLLPVVLFVLVLAIALGMGMGMWLNSGSALAPEEERLVADWPTQVEEMTFVRGRKYRDWNRIRYYAMYKASPETIDELKARILEIPVSAREVRIDDTDDHLRSPCRALVNPKWWHPEEEKDADLLSISGERWYAFCREQGLIYVFVWAK